MASFAITNSQQSLLASLNLNKTSSDTSLQRLSSGMKINQADGPASSESTVVNISAKGRELAASDSAGTTMTISDVDSIGRNIEAAIEKIGKVSFSHAASFEPDPQPKEARLELYELDPQSKAQLERHAVLQQAAGSLVPVQQAHKESDRVSQLFR